MTIESINVKIGELAKSEKVSKALLIELSREVLAYVYTSGDITPTNRLLRALSPMNKRMCEVYFQHFLAWHFDTELCEFTKKNKKSFEKKQELVEIFLLDDANNVFTWASEHVKVEPKPIDWEVQLKKTLIKSLENGLTVDTVMNILESVLNEEENLKAA